MVGQENILKQINSYTLATLPSAILLLGPAGAGKHTISNILANNLNLEVVDIDGDIDADELTEYYQCAIHKLYRLNFSDIQEKSQNKFLKLLEEPSIYMHIIVLAQSESFVLPTIVNRCIKLKLEDYTVDQLKQVLCVNNELLYVVCKTPGKLLEVDPNKFDELINICTALCENIHKISYSSIMSISTKINFKEEYDKFDFSIFLNTLEYISYRYYIENNSSVAYTIFVEVNYFNSMRARINPLKENFILSLLSSLWEKTHLCN